jgi:hypothetical protein
MMFYFVLFMHIVSLLLLMVFEIYNIYEYRTCSNYDTDYVFICD